MNHAPFTHHHPRRVLSLRTRTRLFGTFNVAVALSGRSCGWGSCEKPRRTFMGHHRINRNGGMHFIELETGRRTLFRVGDRISSDSGSDRG